MIPKKNPKMTILPIAQMRFFTEAGCRRYPNTNPTPETSPK
jgi:hypothetical protein